MRSAIVGTRGAGGVDAGLFRLSVFGCVRLWGIRVQEQCGRAARSLAASLAGDAAPGPCHAGLAPLAYCGTGAMARILVRDGCRGLPWPRERHQPMRAGASLAVMLRAGSALGPVEVPVCRAISAVRAGCSRAARRGRLSVSKLMTETCLWRGCHVFGNDQQALKLTGAPEQGNKNGQARAGPNGGCAAWAHDQPAPREAVKNAGEFDCAAGGQAPARQL
jgi:hypothetical protein